MKDTEPSAKVREYSSGESPKISCPMNDEELIYTIMPA